MRSTKTSAFVISGAVTPVPELWEIKVSVKQNWVLPIPVDRFVAPGGRPIFAGTYPSNSTTSQSPQRDDVFLIKLPPLCCRDLLAQR